jgi:hypothetical protein
MNIAVLGSLSHLLLALCGKVTNTASLDALLGTK